MPTTILDVHKANLALRRIEPSIKDAASDYVVLLSFALTAIILMNAAVSYFGFATFTELAGAFSG